MTKMNALNRAFEKAFAHTATKETLMDLLSCLGDELSCDRIAIFEAAEENTFDNTYEWCREGALKEKTLLQGIPRSRFDTWNDRLSGEDYLLVRDLEKIRRTDPDVYELFHVQEVEAVIVTRLAFHGKEMGFVVVENPDGETMDETEFILPGMRYILSSLVYSDHLVKKLEKIGYLDRLTGTGNRMSLQEHMENLDHSLNLGMVYAESICWDVDDGRVEHLKEEQRLLRTGQVLCDVYDEDSVFRVGADEFLVIVQGADRTDFERREVVLRNLFRENDILAAVGIGLSEDGTMNPEALIRQVRLAAYSEKKTLMDIHERTQSLSPKKVEEKKDKAIISLPRGDVFFQQAEELLSQVFGQPVMTAVVDVNYFKLYNDIFGRKAGSLLLEGIAASLEEEARMLGGLAGYLGGDNFCFISPVPGLSQERIRPFVDRFFRNLNYSEGFMPAMGIYISYDREENVITMYDRSLAALQEIKGSYMEHYRFYDAGHFQHLKEDKILLMDIREGIAKGEFTFYLQPQVHERTGKVVGAEALVRWRKNGQIVEPGKFIPLLEKTGYIFAVDCNTWECVARWLRQTLDRGLTPVQCSVNVSRVDFYFTDIAEHFINLMEKYDLPHWLIGIEITESAFTDNTDTILNAVKKLHEAGFRLLMDDFGSGSSSLSMLHTMHLDVLKTDVRFMSRKSADSRAVSIVEAVISMAHMIGMLVVTEGVETEEQKENLIALGDNYAQGFYFYRPMPVEEFEAILADPEKMDYSGKKKTRPVSHIGFRNMIRKGMVSDTLLDNIIGPAAVYMEKAGCLTIEQLNEQYSVLTGIGAEDSGKKEQVMELLHRDQEAQLYRILRGADVHPLEGSSGFMTLHRGDGSSLDREVRIFLLYSCEDYKLYLLTLQTTAPLTSPGSVVE